jgi:hypothetical protein
MDRRHSFQSTRRYGRREILRGAGIGAAGIAVAGTFGRGTTQITFAEELILSGVPFDFDNGNAPVDVIVPTVIPVIFQSVSPAANDATLVLRITALITNAWFDSIAPYHPTAVGVYSKLARRPVEETTDTNRNTAIFYASYRVLNSLLPRHTQIWDDMLMSVGLNPTDDSQDVTTAIGIGNVAGNAVVSARLHDGMNQLGDEGGRIYNRQPYADYLGFEPVNTAYKLKDASRWQPQMVGRGNGIFCVQQFVTPQMRVTTPYSLTNLTSHNAPPPVKSKPSNPGYKAQADEVLSASANLTDYQKMVAELFDNKLLGLGFSALFASQSKGLSLLQFVEYDFLTNLAAFDTAIVVWKEKARHDAVRPFSAIRHLYKDSSVTAWGGPGKGTVSDLPANQWQSYLGTADHPEYPSGSASFCSAHAEASRLYFDSDVLGSDVHGWSVPAPQGSSRIEPGVTPSQDIMLGPWNTWTDFEEECGLSRLWGGVHFMASIVAGRNMGKAVGKLAHDFVQAHIDGTAG